MKKVAKYSLIVAGWLILGIIVLLLLVSLLIQTRPVKNKIADVAENQAEKFINGDLSIGRIDGNFFTGLELEDLLLTYENDTVAYIAELNLSYNLRSLLDNELFVSEAAVKEPYFYLKQYQDSTWNVQKIVKPTEKTDTTTSEGMDLYFPDFSISEGNIKTETLDTVIPQRIQNINTELSFQMSGDEMIAELQEFNFSTMNPDFTLNQLAFEFRNDSSYFELSNLHLKTAMNQLSGQAEYESATPRKGSAHIESEELQLQEFEYFIPQLKIPAKPVVQIDAEIVADSVHVVLDLKDQNQQIALNAKSSNLADYLFEDTDEMLDYNLQGSLQNVELGHWLGDPQLDYMLNGELSANGRGIDPANAEIMVKANFGETVVEDKSFQELLVDLEMLRGNLRGMVQGNGEFGFFRVEPNIRNLLESPVYDIKLITEELNLAQLLGNDSLSSNLNLTADISGESFEPEQINARAEIVASDSRFREINLDTLVADAQYSNENINIDTLWLFTQTATLTAGGNYNLNGPSDIQLTADFNGIEEFQSYIPVTELNTSGKLKANISGTPDSLTADAMLQLDTTSYQEMTLKKLNLDARGHIAGRDTLFDAKLNVYEFTSGDFVIDTVNAEVEGNMDSLYVNADVAGEDINTKIATGFVPGETMRFTLNDWQIDYKNQQWALQQSPAVIEIDSMNYRVRNFKLATSDADSAQHLIIDGLITRSGEENFMLKLANIDMEELSKTFEQDFEAGGTLDLNLNIDGTAKSPLITGDFTLNEAQLNEYTFTDFGGNLNYDNNQLNFETLIVPEDSGKVDISGTLPLRLNLDTMGYHFDPEDSINGQVVIDSFSLAILQMLDVTGNIQGFLQGNVDVRGTLKDPDPKGNIRLVDASVEIDQYGINYEEIKLNLEFLKTRVLLDTLQIISDDGYLTGTGAIDFSSAFYEGDVSESKIQLDFNTFNLLDHNQFNMQVSGNANLSGEKGHVVYGGDIKIPQAEIYLPAILGMLGEMDTPEMPEPILVRHAQRMEVSLDSIGVQTFQPPKTDSMGFDYFDELEGQLRIRIPKNTWIKNEDMRIEISGEVELIKNQEFFELFGTVEVVRGQYDLLGKTFVIDEGSISFQGGEEILPRINISATYSFRNAERVEQELTVQITGTAEEPEVEFLLDGASITEGDALSYILFGKSMNSLTMSEQQNLEGAGGGSLAERAAASVISSQLTDFLGRRLNVDYIEVKSEGSFSNASLVVGKYITNDLFVSYEQRFGEVDEKDLAKYEVMLEYQLFRFLFLELNNSSNDSGFDVIVKFDVK